jgi:bacterioferritin (cytochrome b1)
MVRHHDRAHEREAQGHDRSADRYEQHARLLDRYGAHRSAKTERRHAEDERELANATRRRKTRG